MSCTVLVTGASGFVGSHLAQALTDGGHRVRAMTRHPEEYAGAGEPVEGDVADPASLVSIAQIVPGRPMGYDEAVCEAFGQRAEALAPP